MSKESVIEHLTEENNRLREELERVKAERDAAIRDTRHIDYCEVCIGSVVGCDCECESCRINCRCKDCRDGSKYQWRGLQAAEAALKEGKG